MTSRVVIQHVYLVKSNESSSERVNEIVGITRHNEITKLKNNLIIFVDGGEKTTNENIK